MTLQGAWLRWHDLGWMDWTSSPQNWPWTWQNVKNQHFWNTLKTQICSSEVKQITNERANITNQYFINGKLLKSKNDTDKIPCSLFAKGAMLFFFCYISVHKKPHKVKVHIATVAPEFNVTPWPKQKSAKNRAQNSVQSISSLKITQGQKCSS